MATVLSFVSNLLQSWRPRRVSSKRVTTEMPRARPSDPPTMEIIPTTDWKVQMVIKLVEWNFHCVLK